MYKKYVVAALPSTLSSALSMLYKNEESNVVRDEDWSTLTPILQGGGESIEDILNTRQNIFPTLLEQLRQEREVKIIKGGQPGEMMVDVCFVMDCTGSMSAWLVNVKAQVNAIARNIKSKINEQYPEIKLCIRFGMV